MAEITDAEREAARKSLGLGGGGRKPFSRKIPKRDEGETDYSYYRRLQEFYRGITEDAAATEDDRAYAIQRVDTLEEVIRAEEAKEYTRARNRLADEKEALAEKEKRDAAAEKERLGKFAPRNRFEGMPGGFKPNRFWDSAGKSYDLTAQEQIEYAPAWIRQQIAEFTGAAEEDLSPGEIATRRTLKAQLPIAEAAVGRLQARELGVGGTGTGAGTGAGRTEFESERRLRAAQTKLAEVQAEKARRDMWGKQQAAFQEYYETAQIVAKMIADRTMEPNEANAHMDLLWRNLQASMRGATPFEEEKFRKEETRQRAGIGRDILNQRLASSTSMGNTLMQFLTQNAKDVRLGPGESLGFDPYAAARSYTTEVGGGEQMGQLAQTLLGALGSEMNAPAQPAPAAPEMGTLQTLLGLLRQHQEDESQMAGVTP